MCVFLCSQAPFAYRWTTCAPTTTAAAAAAAAEEVTWRCRERAVRGDRRENTVPTAASAKWAAAARQRWRRQRRLQRRLRRRHHRRQWRYHRLQRRRRRRHHRQLQRHPSTIATSATASAVASVAGLWRQRWRRRRVLRPDDRSRRTVTANTVGWSRSRSVAVAEQPPSAAAAAPSPLRGRRRQLRRCRRRRRRHRFGYDDRHCCRRPYRLRRPRFSAANIAVKPYDVYKFAFHVIQTRLTSRNCGTSSIFPGTTSSHFGFNHFFFFFWNFQLVLILVLFNYNPSDITDFALKHFLSLQC